MSSSVIRINAWICSVIDLLKCFNFGRAGSWKKNLIIQWKMPSNYSMKDAFWHFNRKRNCVGAPQCRSVKNWRFILCHENWKLQALRLYFCPFSNFHSYLSCSRSCPFLLNVDLLKSKVWWQKSFFFLQAKFTNSFIVTVFYPIMSISKWFLFFVKKK